MPTGLCANRRCASVPSLGLLVGLSSLQPIEVPGAQDKGSQACFSPVFDLELDAKLGASSNHLDRCYSHQQLGEQLAPAGSLLQQMLTLCRCSSPVQAQLLQHIQRLRTAAYAASPTGSSTAGGLPAGGSGHSGNGDAATAVLASEAVGGGSFAAVLDEARLDVEAMACELLAMGYMVQVRDGAQQQERSKTPRSCLQNLRHRYIVCLGVRSCGDGEPSFLPEPLVVEPRFREQFTIAHPTTVYEALLQSVPPCFVGPVANLEAVVRMMGEQIHCNFKVQGLPVPPWRTRTALLSKWSPAQLSDLSAKIASLRRLAAAVPPISRGIVPCQSHDRLFNGDRPAAAHADHAAVGSAPTSAALHSHAAGQAATPAAAVSGRQHCALTHHAVAAQAPGIQIQQGGSWAVIPRVSTGVGLQGAAAELQALPSCEQGMSTRTGGVGALGAAPPAGLMGPPKYGVEQPSAACSSVLAALAAAGSHNEPRAGVELSFTRKASAEWKHQRSSSRMIKGLLATALKKSHGSRSNLLAPAGASAVAEYVVSQATSAAWPSSGSGGAHQQTLEPVASESSGDVLIRRTHFRATCDEPWRRITTVRLGGYAQQQRPVAPQAAAAPPS